MNLIRRLILIALGLALMAAGVWLVLASTHVIDGFAWHWPGLTVAVDPAFERVPFRLTWLAASIAVLGLGSIVTLIATSWSSDGAVERVVLKASDPNLYGDTRVTISRGGLHSITARVARDVEGVREAKARVGLAKRGWIIRCSVSTWDRAIIPEIARQVSDDVRRLIEHHTGIPVATIDIDVQYEAFTTPARARVV